MKLLLFLIFFPPLILATCPASYTVGPNGIKCFKAYEEPLNYFGAEHTCSLDGAHLASITSSFENTFVANLIPDGFGYDHWIGLTTSIYGWEWSWLDETPVLYSNWATGQPNTTNMCTLISGTTLRWATQDCSTKLPFICNWAPETTAC